MCSYVSIHWSYYSYWCWNCPIFGHLSLIKLAPETFWYDSIALTASFLSDIINIPGLSFLFPDPYPGSAKNLGFYKKKKSGGRQDLKNIIWVLGGYIDIGLLIVSRFFSVDRVRRYVICLKHDISMAHHWYFQLKFNIKFLLIPVKSSLLS